jgi:nicotinate-nucleotide pyrophosphorylase (carboxylating)
MAGDFVDFLESVDEVVAAALREDVGTGDVTAALIPELARTRARVITREAAVLCGSPWFSSVFRQLDPDIEIQWRCEDGAEVQPNAELCVLAGPTRALLTGERTALNFLQTLTGTATVTRAYVQALAGLPTRILDTRKTIPGLRLAQKYAVRCGGGHNHRMGLYDGVLIKENHICAAGSIQAAVRLAKTRNPGLRIEVEVEDLGQLQEVMDAAADIVLLDNFTLEKLREAVTLAAGRVELEASGGVDLASLRAAAATGVDYISVGSLTKHVRATDLSMRFLE